MKRIHLFIVSLIIFSLCALLVACEKDEDIVLTTIAVSQEQFTPSYSSATLQCSFATKATLRNVYVQYTTAQDFIEYDEIEMSHADDVYSVILDGLQDNTTYYVRYVVSNRYSSAIIKEISKFKTLQLSKAIIITSSVTNITPTSATVGGNVTDDGGMTITERGVVYGTSQNPTTANSKVTSGSGTGSFACLLTNLQEGTTYYVRAYAVNEKGTSYGEQKSFTTKVYTLPTVTTSSATNLTSTSATIGGNVTSDGAVTVTERGVVYSTSSNPTTSNSKVTSGSGTGSFSVNLTNLVEGTIYYVRAYATNEKGTAYGNQVVFTTLEVPIENGHEYVDLGLSVKWATCNVGASKPEESGDYFAWGETTTKSTYSWSTYTYCKGSSTTLTKYNCSSGYGTLDNKTTLELSDDVAAINWGGAWRMPTDAEITELREQCTWTWITQNGITGYRVTSKKNSNSIFLPAASYCYVYGFYTSDSGHYWSSSLNTDNSYNAWSLYFNSDKVRRGDTYITYRYYGYSVRPVYGEYIAEAMMPTVTTSAITQITETTAVAGGNVTSDGGATVTERGVVYSTSQNPTTANSKVQCGSGTGAFSCNLSNLQENTTYYVRAYAINKNGTSYGEQNSFTTNKSTSSNTDYQYVDLGLSVKWATCNVGASKPEECGDYFAWGETKPKSSYISSNYTYTSNPSTLPMSNVAARVNWGGSWRMPTKAEQDELRTNCTWTWTTQNGVKGYKVTSKSNSNSIFLPAAGDFYGTSLYDEGSKGYYWSSSLYDNSSYAYYLSFTSYDVGRYSNNRFRGQSVRPVCP